MEQNSKPARKRKGNESKPTADLRAKRLFSLKQVVARLMKACIPEYKDCTIEEILQECLSPGPPSSSIGKVEDVPWAEHCEHVTSVSTEKILPGEEHAVHLDVLFEANLPKNVKKKDKMLIGIEIQNDFRGIDNILGRGIFYLSVMTVSQYGERFRAPCYGKLQPVSSIWICPMAPRELASTILTIRHVIEVIPEEKSQTIRKRIGHLATQTMVLVNLNGDIKPPDDIRGFLWTLTNQDMGEENKFQIMKEVYSMTNTEELNSSVRDFSHCFFDWFGRNNFKRHMKQHYQEGRAKGKAEGDYQRQVVTARKMLQQGYTDAQITALLDLPTTVLSAIRMELLGKKNTQTEQQ